MTPIDDLLKGVDKTPAKEKSSKVKRPRKTPVEDPTIAFTFREAWFVFLYRTEKRKTFQVVEAKNAKSYLRKKAKWELASPIQFPSRGEALAFVDTLGPMLTLEDPSKAPRRPGGPRELTRVERLKSFQESELLEKLCFASEYQLLHSLLWQYDHQENTLTPKQWLLLWSLFDRIQGRQKAKLQRTK